MQKGTFYETIDLATLGQEALEEFCRELYSIHCKIFDGVEASQFELKVFYPDAKWTKIRVFKNIEGNSVGYCSLHAFEKTINSEGIIVFRAETGLLKEYRRQGNVFPFFLKEAIKHKILHPFKKAYFFCTLVHPSSYHLISRFFFRSYPNIKYATPADVLDKMYKIADAFHEVQLPNVDLSVRQVGWITRQTPEEKSQWSMSSDPDTGFFLKKNPEYHKGQGLMTLVPLSLKNIFLTSLIFVYYRGTRLVPRVMEKLQRGRQ